MKLKFLVTILIFSGCQSHTSRLSNDLSKSLRTSHNPTLIALQIFTGELKREKNQWPNTIQDFTAVYSDIAGDLFSEFEDVRFSQQNDTLVIYYRRGDEWKVTNYDTRLVHLQLFSDSAKIQIEQNVEKRDYKKKYKSSEGKMSFINQNNNFTIIHEFDEGVSKNTMK